VNALSDTEQAASDENQAPTDDVNNSGTESAPDSEDDGSPSDGAENCRAVSWGTSCKKGNQIYNLAFTGVEAATKKSVDTSFEDLHCLGYNSAVIVAGDENCTVCPGWYREVGVRIDDIHDANSVVIAISTADFGRNDLSDQDALEETKMMQPDYATGSNPFVYPCRYDFTPYTMVVNLRTAEILDMDSLTYKLTMDRILALVDEANR
jgi:hypothetical protein